ncbi:MAG: hypothetical protein K2W95_09510 [Candidatus Obscuribacterales bacterium]|nr:hypothetical protein [Candidatus Obscuribacterales bacterium]
MAFSLTSDQIMAMAPDDSSAKAGRDLARQAKWGNLGANGSAAWGECQGSGAKPYQTSADLTEIAFKCSCPSRKFPCKHGLGLLLLLAKEPAAFATTEMPEWTNQWMAGRQERSEKKVKKAEEPAKAVDEESRAKRAAKREQKVDDGVADLSRWLEDAVRHGLADLQGKPYQFWEGQAKRLVDAQASGLARLVRECGGIVSSGSHWQDRLLDRLARIHLLLEAYRRIDALPAPLACELRNLIGYNVPQEEVLARAGINDTWYVTGQSVEEDERLKSQRTWLYGETTGKSALVLAFAFGNAYLDTSLLPGTKVEAEIVYFPGNTQSRALIKSRRGQPCPYNSIPCSANTVNSVFAAWGESLAKNPWTELCPVALKDVRAVPIDGGKLWELQDEAGHCIQMSTTRDVAWSIMALSRGAPMNLFGEWNGRRIYPLSVSQEGRFMRCNAFVAK